MRRVCCCSTTMQLPALPLPSEANRMILML
jgi:hypothetical protein